MATMSPMMTDPRILREGWDEAANLIQLLDKDPTSVSIFHPFGGGYNIQFGADTHVIRAWQKAGNASDEAHARLTERNRTLEDKIKELEDKLEFFELNFEKATKAKDEAVYNLDQKQDELEGVLKTMKGLEDHQLQHNTLNLNAENAEKKIIQSREKIITLSSELLISQDDNSQLKEKYETQRKERERLLQSANGKLKTSNEKLKSMSLELINAKNLILINDAASKELKKESDGKISSMEIALSEAKLDNQISNNASALKSNEVENSKTTQTEPISANEENSEEINIYPITWEEFDKIAVSTSKVFAEFNAMLIRKYGNNIYIRKNNGTVSVPLKKAL